MSTASIGAPGRGRGRGEEGGSTIWFWLIVAGAVALIALLVAWLGGWIRSTTDPRVAEIRVLQDDARAKYAANGGPATVVEATAAVAAMAEIQRKVDALPEGLREQVERSGGGMMRDMFRGRINSYFAAAPEQRRAELDRQIDQEEIMRQAFEAARTLAGQGGAGGGGGPPRGASEEGRNRWRKSMIDRTTPEDRARYAEYRRAMEERRRERGMPSGSGR